ncbi:sodium-dependent transporter [Pseudomonas lalucatii]|uniref:Transporter n=1 Tax=Pseudomonas lalucatii TaxID=1424203 RepID=A0ABS5Q304_9PSED|nr:sodium-dependent transporter [Pseudomonas lalucatii]MBS7663127.1 sodium-dependent transporter [Pseudomonas lalucatii]MBS7724842.1 sodium-dependent transporter [Pseudomonas lalucatii]QVM87185.1 sodium-dependent transporter [Pseudomonas lalucatii]
MSQDSIAAGHLAGASSNVGRGLWSSRWAFFLAATGSAVGLGNIWKFPYITGENGGGAFVLVYLACILVIGIPLLMAEVMIGRRGRANPEGAMAALARQAGASRHWRILGSVAVLTGFLILSFYAVVAGWAVAYAPAAAMGEFAGLDGERSGALFGAMLGDPWKLAGFGTLVLLVTLGIVALGVREGLERALRFMMPGLFLLLLVLVGYAATTGHFGAALHFLFDADFSKLSAQSVLVALGHAFFTLSLASGAMMVYGSYLPAGTSIARTAIMVALADTGVALLAGLAIFPLVFANGLEPGAGPGLIFVTLPIAFGQMPLGQLVGGLFFVMLAIAALTSAISLSEPTISWLSEKFGIGRLKAVLLSGVALWLLSLGTVLSFNAWSEFTLFGKTFFDCLDYLTTNLLMPLGGLGTVLFTGWVLSRDSVQEALGLDQPRLFKLWWQVLRWVTPLGILVVFLHTLGLFG